MRALVLAACVMAAFIGPMTLATSEANAVVCARGVHHAGCTGPNTTVVVRRPVAAPMRVCKSELVKGVYIRRCS